MTTNRDTKHRTELAPLSVRLSPEERAMCREKAAFLRVAQGELMRLALAAYDVKAATELSRITFHDARHDAATGDLTVEYDPPEVANG